MVESQPVESTVTPQPGDLIRLGAGAPQDFRGSPAVVTQIAAAHCTVAVLDPSRRRAIGECWPNHRDCLLVSMIGRLGTRVVIDGFQKGRGKSLNGSVGTIVAHKKEGHPCFVRKAAGSDEKVTSPVLVCCVELDVPVHAKDKQVLVEPLFLAKLPHASEVAIALAAAALISSNDVEKQPTPCGLSSPPPSPPLAMLQPLPAPGASCQTAASGVKTPLARPLKKPYSQALCGEPGLGTPLPRSPAEGRCSGSGGETPCEQCGSPASRAHMAGRPPGDEREREGRQKVPARSFADLLSWAWLAPSPANGGDALRKQPPAEKPVSWRELLCSSGRLEGESDGESDGSEPLPALQWSCCAASRKQKKVRRFPDKPVSSSTFFDSRTRSYTDCSTAYSPSSSFSPRNRLAPFFARVEAFDATADHEFHDALEDVWGDAAEEHAEREGEAHFDS